MTLLVIVPTRGRKVGCKRLLKSFTGTADFAELVFVTDPDDEKTYAGMNWGDAAQVTLSPRQPLSGKLNTTAKMFENDYDAIMWVADDHVFETPHWDTVMTGVLESMGGSGILYPDDKRRSDVPEVWMISTDIIRELWFSNPDLNHYYTDNSWAELGRRSGLIRRVPEVVIPHRHYSVDAKVKRDKTYTEAEKTWGASDQQAFFAWRKNGLPVQVSQLRRKFNPDVTWVLGKVRELCGADHGPGDGSHLGDGASFHGPPEPVQCHVL
jgi:hypothetical protein